MINFCAIAPVKYLLLVKNRPVHLLLAHLVEDNEEYRNFYADLRKENPHVVYIGDNSAYEFYKQGKSMYPAEKLIDVYSQIGVDYIVASDYPGQHSSKTINAAIDLIPKFKAAGIKTFFCPQSEINDFHDYLTCMRWAIDNSDVGLIGLSILGVPNAFGIRQSSYQEGGKADEMYRLQRFLSRWRMLNIMDQLGMLTPKTFKRFHLLGLLDGYTEYDLIKPYENFIFSADSSSPVWHGINGVGFDCSPTGLLKGKLESEVDFNCAYYDNAVDKIMFNLEQIDSCLE